MELLSFTDVHKDYTSDSPALAGVTFSVQEGEFTALAGPSGSGKTTILNIAAGLDKASRGDVILLGKNLGQSSTEEISDLRRYSVGFVFQAYNLIPILSAVENVEYPLALRRIAPKDRRKMAEEALAEVGLADYADRMPANMSGGQQQRVAVARAMVTHPKIVFADEPTANLDSRSAENLLRVFRELNRSKKTTFLFSSHDPRVLAVADRIIELYDGRVSQDVRPGVTKPRTEKTPHPMSPKSSGLHLIQ